MWLRYRSSSMVLRCFGVGRVVDDVRLHFAYEMEEKPHFILEQRDQFLFVRTMALGLSGAGR